jgi:Flp pilus assembly protein TadG
MIQRTRGYLLRRGTAAVEFGFLAPILVTLLLGIWEVGRLAQVQQVLTNATREGARQASTGQKTTAQVQQSVLTYLSNDGITTTGTTVTLTNLTSSSRSDPTTANQLDRFEITVNLPFSNVQWTVANHIVRATNLTATVDWLSMRDIPLSVSTIIPIE